MPAWFETVTDPAREAEVLARRSYGVIAVVAGQLQSIRLRPYPRGISLWELFGLGEWPHRRLSGDRCWLYYNQPRQCPNFLALRYVVSARGASFATFRTAVAMLDEVARIKHSDAIVCDAANLRISERLLARWGWERHTRSRWHRNYIKRLYPGTSVRDRFRAQLEAELAAASAN